MFEAGVSGCQWRHEAFIKLLVVMMMVQYYQQQSHQCCYSLSKSGQLDVTRCKQSEDARARKEQEAWGSTKEGKHTYFGILDPEPYAPKPLSDSEPIASPGLSECERRNPNPQTLKP